VLTKPLSEEAELTRIKILKVCITPQKLKEVMKITGYKHRNTFVTNYIAPLVKEGLIELTLPNTPRKPRQMYQTTEKGRATLKP
jgi:ATP-dependent DNA helicase RecG